MRKLGWIWFAGCAVWVLDALVSLHFRSWAHAELAFMVALVFFAAGLLYRTQRR